MWNIARVENGLNNKKNKCGNWLVWKLARVDNESVEISSGAQKNPL